MSRIHELNEAQEELLNRLYWLDTEDEADQAEIELIKKELCKIRGDAEHTFEFLSGIYLNFIDDAERHFDEQKRLNGLAYKAEMRKKSAQSNADRIERIMLYIGHKFDIPKISTKYGDFVRSITPGAVVYSEGFDAEKLPDDLVKEIPAHKEPLTKAIMAKLRLKIFDPKAKKLDPTVLTVVDDDLPGVMLVRKEQVKIK